MLKAKCNWTKMRTGLRRFALRTGWTAAQIAKALRVEYGYAARNMEIELLLDGDWRDPLNAAGYTPMGRLLSDNCWNTPPFDDWLAKRRARAPASIYAEGDAIIARAMAVEEQRDAVRRHWLSREVRHGGRLEIERDPVLDGLDAATISALSCGTLRSLRA